MPDETELPPKGEAIEYGGECFHLFSLEGECVKCGAGAR